MLDNSISIKNIRHLLSELHANLREFDNSISMVWFGSSLNCLSENNLDIDLLLLSEISYYPDNSVSYTNSLKNTLQSGLSVRGYLMENEQIARIFGDVIQKQVIIENSLITPKFIFGPFKITNEDNHNSQIYLHIKGPLTENEFCYFCRELPYHGSAIIKQHEVISGNFNCKLFLDEINLSADTLDQFNLGLNRRVMVSDSSIEVRKCIKKLKLNYDIYRNITTDNSMFIKHLDSIDQIDILKVEFINLYNEISKR